MTPFINKYRSAAQKIADETGIPVERILAQAGHETGWNVDAPGNNFFGIKAGPGYSGKSQVLDTTEDYGKGLQKVKQPFRVYDNPEDSFRDWANLIKTNYSDALQPGIPDAEYTQALKAGGYATDPQYAPKLRKVIEDTRTALSGSSDLPSKYIDGPGAGGNPTAGILAPSPTATGMMAGVPGFDPSDPGAYANRTAGDADMGGYGGSPKLPDKNPYDWNAFATKAGLGLLGQQQGTGQQQMGNPIQAPGFQPMPQAPAASPVRGSMGLLGALTPDRKKKNILLGGLLGGS